MYFVYIIKSKISNKCYIGSTANIKQRIKDHNAGKNTSTVKHKPYKLAWCCIFPNQEKAIKFEKYLKSGSGNAFFRRHLI